MILLSTHKRHPGDSFKRQEEAFRRAYAHAFSLKDRFPSVQQLVAEMAFIDVQDIGRYSAQLRSFSSAAKAFFTIPCPRTQRRPTDTVERTTPTRAWLMLGNKFVPGVVRK